MKVNIDFVTELFPIMTVSVAPDGEYDVPESLVLNWQAARKALYSAVGDIENYIETK